MKLFSFNMIAILLLFTACEQSAGTSIEDSEWEVYELNYFEDVFQHSCFPR